MMSSFQYSSLERTVFLYLEEKYPNQRMFPNRKLIRAELRRVLMKTDEFRDQYPCARCFNTQLTRILRRWQYFPVDLHTQESDEVENRFVHLPDMTPSEAFQWQLNKARGMAYDDASMRDDILYLQEIRPEWHIDVDGWMIRLKRAAGL